MTDRKEAKVLSYDEKYQLLLNYACQFGAGVLPEAPEEDELDRRLADYESWIRRETVLWKKRLGATGPD